MIKQKLLWGPLLIILLLHTDLRAQQDAQYTQYMYNTMSVNPAYAGSRGQLSMSALYRAQWIGLDGAPTTTTLNLHSPIRNSRVGYGLSLVHDEIGEGVIQETYIDGVISYSIETSRTAKMSFGLTVSGNLLNLDFTGLNNFDQEPIAGDNIENKFTPNFGLGFYYHSDRFYAGLSAPKLLESDHFDNSNRDANQVQFLSTERMNLYFITGYVMELSRGGDMLFKPALLTKVVRGAPIQIDLSATFLYNEKFSFGAAYRWDAAISGMAGFQISDQLMLGLAYDKETTELGSTRFNDGSFEIFIRYELLKNVGNLVSPRFF